MIQIVITLQDDGQLTITGPIQNRVMAYGLLELAKDAIRAHEAPKSGIVPVHIIPPSNGGSQP